MPFSADAIANFFLDRASEAHRGLTQMQVQKLAFYSHGWYLALDEQGRPLIGEPVEVWKLGPVFRSLYRAFRDFGSSEITKKAREIRFSRDSTDGKLRYSFLEPSVDSVNPSDINKPLALAVLNRVWEIYGGFTAYQLSNMTHAEGEPWRIIRDAMPSPLPKGLHIPIETIRDCFKKKLSPVRPI